MENGVPDGEKGTSTPVLRIKLLEVRHITKPVSSKLLIPQTSEPVLSLLGAVDAAGLVSQNLQARFHYVHEEQTTWLASMHGNHN